MEEGEIGGERTRKGGRKKSWGGSKKTSRTRGKGFQESKEPKQGGLRNEGRKEESMEERQEE